MRSRSARRWPTKECSAPPGQGFDTGEPIFSVCCRWAAVPETCVRACCRSESRRWGGVEGSARDLDRLSTHEGIAAAARFDPGMTTSDWQPLRLDAGHLRINAKVNGVPVSAILDSGAGRTMLDDSLVRELHLTRRSGYQVGGFTSDIESQVADGLNIRIGALQICPLTGAVLNLANLRGKNGDVVGLVIGRELFESTLVDLNFPRNRVAFLSPGSKTLSIEAEVLPLQSNGRGGRQFPVSINGGTSVDSTFDIEYNDTLMISPAYADVAGILNGRRVSTALGLGIEGPVISRVTVIDKSSYWTFPVSRGTGSNPRKLEPTQSNRHRPTRSKSMQSVDRLYEFTPRSDARFEYDWRSI